MPPSVAPQVTDAGLLDDESKKLLPKQAVHEMAPDEWIGRVIEEKRAELDALLEKHETAQDEQDAKTGISTKRPEEDTRAAKAGVDGIFQDSEVGEPEIFHVDFAHTLPMPRDLLATNELDNKPYTIEVNGGSTTRKFDVLPGVFSPKHFVDSVFFARNLSVRPGETMCEVGPGTGIISIFAVDKGVKRVVAIDINPAAVENTRKNVLKNNLQDKIEVREGSVYEPLNENEKFDILFWNIPFIFTEEEDVLDLDKALLNPEYRSTKTFIKDAREHLNPGGRVVIAISSTLGRMDLIEEFAAAANMDLKIVSETGDSTNVRFELVELTPRPPL